MGRALKQMQFAVEYVFLRFFIALLTVTPVPVAIWLANRIADLGYALMARRRRIATDNILACGLRTTHRDASRLARDSFRHFGVSVVEALKFGRLMENGRWREHVRFVTPGGDGEVTPPEGGMIVACGHFGNSDVAGMVLSQWKPLVGIARTLTNPLVDRYIVRTRFQGRFHGIPKHDANLYRFLEIMKEGNALALMTDQHAGGRGMLVPFLGRQASTHTAVALLALISRLPLYFGSCRRTAPMQFECVLDGPIACPRTGNKQADIAAILTALNDRLETCVRTSPEQYLWAHRRWRPRDVDPNYVEPPLSAC